MTMPGPARRLHAREEPPDPGRSSRVDPGPNTGHRWVPGVWLVLAATAALLAAIGSVVGFLVFDAVYGKETAPLGDAVAAQDLVNLVLVGAPPGHSRLAGLSGTPRRAPAKSLVRNCPEL